MESIYFIFTEKILFKKLFDNEENIVDFLKAYLPKELSQTIDFKTLKISDTEKENKKHKKYYLDLAIDCQIAESKSKIYILFELNTGQVLIRLFEYIVFTNDINEQEFIEIVQEIKGDDKMPTIAQQWLDQGMEKGIQQGIQQGVFETAIVMIKDFQIAIDDVVAKLNIKKEELVEYMNKRKEP